MNKKIKYTLLISALLLGTTGCTTYLKDAEGKQVTNERTGQALTENILCRPRDKDTIELYESNGYDLEKLPYCVCNDEVIVEISSKKIETIDEKESNEEVQDSEEKQEVQEVTDDSQEKSVIEGETEETTDDTCNEFSVFHGEYSGLWTSFFVKPLAWIILFFGRNLGSFGLGLIITSILIRLAVYPLTKKSTVQAENMKKVQPELNRLEQKYANKDQKDREVMMAKSQEMMAIYKKYNVSPMAGCLPALLQLPLFIAFLDAINRVPAIFEEKFLGFHLGTTPKTGIVGGNWLYIILTILVAVTTYFAMNKAQTNVGNEETVKQTKMMSNMFTIMIIFMSVFMSSALNIYWVVSNGCTLLQNYLVKRSMK